VPDVREVSWRRGNGRADLPVRDLGLLLAGECRPWRHFTWLPGGPGSGIGRGWSSWCRRAGIRWREHVPDFLGGDIPGRGQRRRSPESRAGAGASTALRRLGAGRTSSSRSLSWCCASRRSRGGSPRPGRWGCEPAASSSTRSG